MSGVPDVFLTRAIGFRPLNSEWPGAGSYGYLWSVVAMTIDELADVLVNSANLVANDVVVEIGHESRAIADAILDRHVTLIVLEPDKAKASRLRGEFSYSPNLMVLDSESPEHVGGYVRFKLVANLLRMSSYAILTSWLQSHNIDSASVLLNTSQTRSVLAKYPTNIATALLRPCWEFSLVRRFAPPKSLREAPPRVALVKISRKDYSLVREEDNSSYSRFVTSIFTDGRGNVAQSLRNSFRSDVVAAIAKKTHLTLDLAPSRLSVTDWVALFYECEALGAEESAPVVKATAGSTGSRRVRTVKGRHRRPRRER